ncbi:MAG: CoA-binding protein [Dehalococcoidia bacterium]
MSFETDDPAVETLRTAKVIAVVGLDTRPERTAHRIASYLQAEGYRIIPVPFQQPADEVLGEKAYPTVAAIPFKVDLVDVFVRSEQTDRVIDDAIEAGAGAIWLQQGITNEAGLARARAAGLVATEDRCTMVEHRRHIA